MEKTELLKNIHFSKIIKNASFALISLLLIALLFPNYFGEINKDKVYSALIVLSIFLVISTLLNSSFKKKYFYKYQNKKYQDVFLKYFIITFFVFVSGFFILNKFSLDINLGEISILISLVSLGSFTLNEIHNSLYTL